MALARSACLLRYQGVRPQPPGAAAFAAASKLGETVRKSTFGHCMVSHLLSTRPLVSPGLAFQNLHHGTAHDCRWRQHFSIV